MAISEPKTKNQRKETKRMALFQKKITFDDLLKAAAALSDEEKKKLRETLDGNPEDAQAEEKEETESEEPEAGEEPAETEPETEPAAKAEDGAEGEKPAEGDGETPETPETPAESEPAEPQEEPAEEAETEDTANETTQDTETDEHIAQMIEQLTERVRGLEESLKEFSELKERMTEYDRKNAEKFGYTGAPGKCRRDTLDMSADELRAAILSGER